MAQLLASLFYCSYNLICRPGTKKKRLSNINEHGLDFVGCEAVFDGLTYVYEDDFQVISLREAEKYEIKRYIKEISR